jgi:solute carrier family 35, member E3
MDLPNCQIANHRTVAHLTLQVFTNKTIFDDPSFRNCQMSFASFHFFVTGLTLYTVSRPWAGMFVPKKAAIREVLPLAAAMCFQVVLPNLSLAYSSVTFYQMARILLTPVVALLNYLLYGSKIPRNAIYPLIPVCFGVALLSYYDSKPAGNGKAVKTTSFWGAIFAIAGVGASSLYTVWIGFYHKKLQMSSMQLLLNQAPVGGVLLLYAIPWIDTPPEFATVPLSMWILIGMSGLFACCINLSQFFIIDQAGPVSSTVVGHLKTCTIVALGWWTSGRTVRDKSVIGIIMAISGIIA